ncbi:LuxR C-terminal-related transcriptional regulator [Metapseudomonas furukawaii]|uniref:LuxR C-terminal-related transcriptional regulator n=1 Tax=Metapseudomonas furukawaii TaxID=1149133 RepID=UPI004045D582
MPAFPSCFVYDPPAADGPKSPSSIKYLPPALGPSHLPRGRLLQQLESSGAARLVLIRAAAGFGKTTLLRQLHDHRLAQRKTTLWVTLDGADNELRRFVATIGACLRPLGLASGDMPSEPQDLLDLLAEVREPFALLLDEFEAIHNLEVLGLVQQMLSLLPSGCLLVMASRAVPGIGLGRIRARGQLLEIRPADLRFTREEATCFLCEKRQLPLSEVDVQALHRRTDGWITGLYLASLSLAGRDDHAAFIASFSGSHLELAEYLAEDVLARQSPECREFLLLSSIPGQFSPELCNALTGREDSLAMIEELDRANLFLVRIDAPQPWFRYHPLFASFLRGALERQDPVRFAQLHEVAARWFFDAGQPIAAIEHLFHAGQDDEAAIGIDRHLDTLLGIGRTRLLLRWIDRLPERTLERYPAVIQAHALLLALSGRLKDAARVAEHLALQAGQAYAALPDAVRCLHLGVTDQVEECYQLGLVVLSRIPVTETHLYTTVSHSVISALLSSGRYAEAGQLMSVATQRDPRIDQGFIGYSLNINEAILDLIQGRLDSAFARFSSMRGAPRHNRFDKPHDTLLVLDALLALTYYERGALDESARLVTRCLPFVKQVSSPDLQIVCHVLSARLALHHGDRHGWLRHLTDLQQLGEQCGSQRMRCAAWLERARVATLDQQLENASQAVRNAEQLADWARPNFSKFSTDAETPLIARQRLRIAQGDHAGAVRELRAALDAALHWRHQRRALKLRLLLATALDGLGRSQEAFEELERALPLASAEGFVSTFMEEGERLAGLCQRWTSQHRSDCRELSIDTALLDALQKRWAVMSPSPEPAGSDEAIRHPLTSREFQVLRLLADGHRNKVIAAKIFLSECTVKSHLQKIYAKLEVGGRTEALALARTQGWLG